MIRFQNISKTFPGVNALSNINFDIEAGEVHAICGENGAGKSTLMNILVGHHQPDAGGYLEINGQKTIIKDFNHSSNAGISIVYQERSLIDNLSIAENIFINRIPVNRLGLLDFRSLNEKTQALLNQLKLNYLQPSQQVSSLSPAEKMMVEIGKALSHQPNVLILDEPTASLTEKEITTLFEIIRQLKLQHVAVIYISHRLAEIFRIADRVTILKDGKYQGTNRIQDTSPDQLIKTMVGREISALRKPVIQQGEAILEIDHLTGERFIDCSFKVHRGEILALAGLIGAGRSEIARVIFGIDRRLNGTIRFNGEYVEFDHPSEAIAKGIGYVPEDRKSQALFLDMSVKENVVSGIIAGDHWIPDKQQYQIADSYKKQLHIQTPDLDQPLRLLSGGNQQKCVLARWLQLAPKLLIVDEPTHGIDIGSKYEIYQLLLDLAAGGTSILLISSELPEVLALADRILVLHLGKITGWLDKEMATEESILALASGNILN